MRSSPSTHDHVQASPLQLGEDPIRRQVFVREIPKEIDVTFEDYYAEGFASIRKCQQARSGVLGRGYALS